MLITGNITEGKSFRQITNEMADEVIKAMIAAGTKPADAERCLPALTARHGLAKIMTEKCWLIDMKKFWADNRFFMDPVLGSFRVEAQGKPHYDITLRDEDEQNCFVVVVQRTGPASLDNPNQDLFWSCNVLFPEVEGDETPALCLGVDITNNTRTYGAEFSGNLYRQPRKDPQTNQWIQQDKLKNLDIPVNFEQTIAGALKAAGFPLHEIRQNRPSPEELKEQRRERRWGSNNASPTPAVTTAPSLVPASAPAGNGGTPYAGQTVTPAAAVSVPADPYKKNGKTAVSA